MKIWKCKAIGCLVLAVFWVGFSKAQTTTPPTQPSVVSPHFVGVNSTHIYDVAYTVRGAVPNIYIWTIYTADASYIKGAVATAGVDFIITAGVNDAIQYIQWLITGNYVIELQEYNPADFGSCEGTLQSLNIFVGPIGTVEFLTATGTDQCPAVGGYSSLLRYSGTILYPITIEVQYLINGIMSTDTISVANATVALDIPAIAGFLENTTATDDMARSVTITSVKDSFGGDLLVGATSTHTLTVWSLPATSPIRHD